MLCKGEWQKAEGDYYNSDSFLLSLYVAHSIHSFVSLAKQFLGIFFSTPPLSLEEVAFMPEESEVFCCVFRTPSPLWGLTLRSALLGKAKASVVAKFVPTRAKEKFTCILPSAAEVRISKQRLLRVVPLIQE